MSADLHTQYTRQAAAVQRSARRQAVEFLGSRTAAELPLAQAEAGAAGPLARSLGEDMSTLAAAAIAATVVWKDDDSHIWTTQVSPDIYLLDDREERFYAGLTILRSCRHNQSNENEPGRLVGQWLAADHDTGWAAAGHLTRHLTSQQLVQDTSGWAWWRIFGASMLLHLAAHAAPTSGRPPRQEKASRETLKAAVRGVHAVGHITKKDLAAMAQISRPTLDSWITST
jgi:hypothetical protein